MKRFALVLVATIAVLLPAGSLVQAASCNGASHEPRLSNGSANPGSGTASTPITFIVVYADTAGCVPSSLTVTVTGVGTFGMTTSGTNFTAGVTYSVTLTIPDGSHTYWFGATSGSGGGQKSVVATTVQPAGVVIGPGAPAPNPVPPPPPDPPPGPVPPTVIPALPQPPPASPGATGSPSAAASITSTPSAGDPSPTEPDATVGLLPGAKLLGRGPGVEKVLGSAAIGGLELPLLGTMIAYLWATAAGLTIFAFLVRRRTKPEPETLSVALATAAAPSALGSENRRVPPLPPMRELIPAVNPNLLTEGNEAPGPLAGEAAIPRWLRPSVRAGRRTRDPNRLSGRDD